MGFQTRLATNDIVILPVDLVIDISQIGGYPKCSYIDGLKHWQIQTLGAPGMSLAQHIAYDLWSEHAVPADVCTTSRQRYYELCRLGTVPLHIALPGDTLTTHTFASTYAGAIAASIQGWHNKRS